MGRGWLTGKYRKLDDLPKDDIRHRFPRFGPKAFDQNFKLVEAVEQVAQRRSLTSSQVAIAWAAHHSAIPIPGTTNIDRVVENSNLSMLTDEDMLELQKIIDTFPIAGERYGGEQEKFLNA